MPGLEIGKLISEKSLMEALGISRSTLYGLRRQGLPSVRIGHSIFYHEEVFRDWILEHNTVTEVEETITGKAQNETGHDTATRPEPKKRRG